MLWVRRKNQKKNAQRLENLISKEYSEHQGFDFSLKTSDDHHICHSTCYNCDVHTCFPDIEIGDIGLMKSTATCCINRNRVQFSGCNCQFY